MLTEVYIENYRLDISKDLSALITYELDNIKDFAARSTTWSKTIVLPGTANNNKLFGHIFQIGQGNMYSSELPNVGYNFNASKSADCIIFQDQLQTFSGVLRLLQINVIKGLPEYEVAVFGKLAGLNVSLSSKYLTDLDFSAYDHIYNETNIVNSWDNTPGSGYYYPLIDYGTYSAGKHDWDIRTFRPALYAKEYIDKMFAAAGFRYSCALFDTDRFKRLVIPHNRKKLQGFGTSLATATIIPTGEPFVDETNFEFDGLSATDFSQPSAIELQYDGTESRWIEILFHIEGTYSAIPDGFYVQIFKNFATIPEVIGQTFFPEAPADTPFSVNVTATVLITPGDTIVLGRSALPGSLWDITVAEFSITNQAGTTVININPGDQTQLNLAIPSNIRQIDFLVGIVKLFNLYVWEDKFDPNLIYIKPYRDYYSTSSIDSVDWTYKLNRDKVVKIKPMSELNARNYNFRYKSDSDYYNDLYRKRYNQGYGDYVYDSEFEFAESEKTLDIIFSATTLIGYDGEEKIYSTIFKRTGSDTTPTEETTDSNIRLLQSKKITGVASWNMKDEADVLVSLTNYGYAGHFNDPDAPDNDLNFGSLRELFFTLITGDLTTTQFNVYWSGYMAEITDKDSKLVTCSVYLTPKDIFGIDFSKKVHIDGVLFRLNSIKDYNATRPSDCIVELLKINYLTYEEENIPPGSGYLLHETGFYLLDSDNSNIRFL